VKRANNMFVENKKMSERNKATQFLYTALAESIEERNFEQMD